MHGVSSSQCVGESQQEICSPPLGARGEYAGTHRCSLPECECMFLLMYGGLFRTAASPGTRRITKRPTLAARSRLAVASVVLCTDTLSDQHAYGSAKL